MGGSKEPPENNPAVHGFDSDKVAVTLLQQALVNRASPRSRWTGFRSPDRRRRPRGRDAVQYGPRRRGRGRQVLGILDILLQGGRLGRDLTQNDAPVARRNCRPPSPP